MEKGTGKRESAIDASISERVLEDFDHLRQKSEKSIIIRKKTLIFSFIALVALSIVAIMYIGDSPEPATPTGIFESQQQFLEEGPLIENPDVEVLIAEQNEELERVESILLEEAQRQDILVRDDEVDTVIKEGLVQYGISDEDLANYLEEQGLSLEDFRQQMKEAIAINQLISENVDLESVEVTDGEVDTYIDDNSLRFQDILADEDASEIFREQVEFQLLAQKQTDLVMDYVSTLQ